MFDALLLYFSANAAMLFPFSTAILSLICGAVARIMEKKLRNKENTTKKERRVITFHKPRPLSNFDDLTSICSNADPVKVEFQSISPDELGKILNQMTELISSGLLSNSDKQVAEQLVQILEREYAKISKNKPLTTGELETFIPTDSEFEQGTSNNENE